MPRHSDPFAAPAEAADEDRFGMTDGEIVELAMAFRHFAFWRLDLDAGLFSGSPALFKIFDMDYAPGPMNLVDVVSRIHPEDLQMLMEAFERASASKIGYHSIYRVRFGGEYKFVRTVAKFRDKQGSVSGELVGITYEFFDRWNTVAFSDE